MSKIIKKNNGIAERAKARAKLRKKLIAEKAGANKSAIKPKQGDK